MRHAQAINIASRGPPWWGVGAVPAPPGHRCDRTGLPVRPQGATFTGQPSGCSRYTAVTRNKPLDFERGGQFFYHDRSANLAEADWLCPQQVLADDVMMIPVTTNAELLDEIFIWGVR